MTDMHKVWGYIETSAANHAKSVRVKFIEDALQAGINLAPELVVIDGDGWPTVDGTPAYEWLQAMTLDQEKA